MLVKKILLKVLEDLLKADFDKFKWSLTLGLLPGCEPIPLASLEDASRVQTVELLVRHYGEETAVKVTAEALNMMKMNEAKEELMRLYTAGTPSSSSSSSSSSARTPSAVMTAQGGSVIIAPNISVGASTGCTINISNKPASSNKDI